VGSVLLVAFQKQLLEGGVELEFFAVCGRATLTIGAQFVDGTARLQA
jgi:hypothetical protein